MRDDGPRPRTALTSQAFENGVAEWLLDVLSRPNPVFSPGLGETLTGATVKLEGNYPTTTLTVDFDTQQSSERFRWTTPLWDDDGPWDDDKPRISPAEYASVILQDIDEGVRSSWKRGVTTDGVTRIRD